MSNVRPLKNRRTWQEWTKLINGAWQKGVMSILETGKMLIDAQGELEHGSWEAMVKLKLPFASSTARRLIAIAEHPILSNRSHVNDLPPSWGTLYALTKVSDETLLAKLKDGTINPKMERKDVAKLLPPKPRKEKSKPPPTSKEPEGLAEWRRDLQGRITSAAFALDLNERRELFEYLRHVLDSTERDLTARDT